MNIAHVVRKKDRTSLGAISVLELGTSIQEIVISDPEGNSIAIPVTDTELKRIAELFDKAILLISAESLGA